MTQFIDKNKSVRFEGGGEKERDRLERPHFHSTATPNGPASKDAAEVQRRRIWARYSQTPEEPCVSTTANGYRFRIRRLCRVGVVIIDDRLR